MIADEDLKQLYLLVKDCDPCDTCEGAWCDRCNTCKNHTRALRLITEIDKKGLK